MAGLGRRTHYRKHLTDAVLNDLPEPKPDERIAKVVSTRGGNQFDILLALPSSGEEQRTRTRTPQLAILPTKFHKLVWVKRNDYVIVQTTVDDDDNEDNGNDKRDSEKFSSTASNKQQDGINDGIRYIITHILYKDQVKHLKSKGIWPSEDPEFGSDHGNNNNNDDDDNHKTDIGEKVIQQEQDDGIVYTDNNYYNYGDDYDDDEGENNDYMDDMFVNTNRLARVEIQDSDDSSSEEEDDG